MRFQIPQFIETEVKIVGPFTLMQFLWIAGGAAILFLLFVFIKGYLFVVLALPIIAIFLALAFMRIDGVPLLVYLTYALSYFLNPKKYIFKKEGQNNLEIK
jgi:hypothetical protein